MGSNPTLSARTLYRGRVSADVAEHTHQTAPQTGDGPRVATHGGRLGRVAGLARAESATVREAGSGYMNAVRPVQLVWSSVSGMA